MRLACADPPYPGQARKHYAGHPDYAGEVDHAQLVAELGGFDGWVLHTSTPALADVLGLVAALARPYRVAAWVKPFASFKRGVPVAYAWEPVIVAAARPPRVGGAVHPSRDWLAEPITMRRGLAGAKPERVCWWAFELMGADPADDLVDLYPGSGAVGRAWETWCGRPARGEPLQLFGVGG